VKGIRIGSSRAERVQFLRARRQRAGLLMIFTVVVAIVLGSLMAQIDAGATVRTSRAGQILTSVGFGIMGLVTIIYSLLFLVVQSSNTTFTPRLNLFQDDPWLYRTYALALGLFTFSMSAFLLMGDDDTQVTVALPLFAFFAALTILALSRRVYAKAFASLQMNSTLDTLQSNGRRVIEDLYSDRPAPETSRSQPLAPAGGRPVLWPRPQTTLRQLELRRLLSAAERSGSVVVFRVGVGETLWPGATVAEVSGSLDDDAVVASCVTGVNRTFHQDPLLAFRLLADIGLRAMSAAINDPATALQVLDAIVGLLLVLAPRDLAVGAINSPSGVTRIHVELPTWADFVGEGLDELLLVSRNSPMVLERAATTLTRLAGQVPPDRLSDVSSRLEQVHEYLSARRLEPSKPDDPLPEPRNPRGSGPDWLGSIT
jgi:uncharacterized membrane protein